MQIKTVILALFLATIAPAFSQELEKSERTCRLVFPEKTNDSPKFVYLFDGKESRRLYLSAVNFSDVVELRPGDINLVMAPEPIADPENIPREYPRLSVPKEIRNFYIFLSVDKTNKVLPLQMKMINLDASQFEPGKTLWCNFTNHHIAAKLGDKKMSIAAGKTTISEKPLSENGYYKAEFIFQPNSTGDFRRITEQSWWFDTDCRYVGFIADRGGMLPRIYFFRDYRAPKAAEAANQVVD